MLLEHLHELMFVNMFVYVHNQLYILYGWVRLWIYFIIMIYVYVYDYIFLCTLACT